MKGTLAVAGTIIALAVVPGAAVAAGPDDEPGGPVPATAISGTSTDPRGDARGGQPDFRSVTIQYDEATGFIRATLSLYSWQGYSYLRFGLSRPHNGGCEYQPTEPDLDVHSLYDYRGEGAMVSYATFNERTAIMTALTSQSTRPGQLNPPIRSDFYDQSKMVIDIKAPELIGVNLRCATRMFADTNPVVEGGDQVTKFCLGGPGCFDGPPRQDPKPAAAPVAAGPTATPTAAPVLTPRAGRAPARLRVRDARDMATRAVARRAGKKWRHARVACESKSRTRVACTLKWRSGQRRYTARAVIDRPVGGDARVARLTILGQK
jgi:hypothetical protein